MPLKPSFKWYVCKGTRFFDTCNSFHVFFSLLIRFLINGIEYDDDWPEELDNYLINTITNIKF